MERVHFQWYGLSTRFSFYLSDVNKKKYCMVNSQYILNGILTLKYSFKMNMFEISISLKEKE